METMQARIKKIRYELSLSVEELAQELKTNGFKICARTLYAYELGERKPSTAFLQALTMKYDINSDWLLTGRGDLFKSNMSIQKQPANVDLSNLVFIPLINMNASAGLGCLIPDEAMTKDFVAFAKNWLTNITVTNPDNLLVFTVVGDSMVGEINDGDMVLVNKSLTELTNSGTYVVCIDDQIYVKILQRIPGNKVQVISKNSKYSAFDVDLNSEYFKIIGRVIWTGGKSDVY